MPTLNCVTPKSINLHGWWGDNMILGLLGMSESFSEKIEYGQIIKVGSPQSVNKSYYSTFDLIDIEFNKYSSNQVIHIKAQTNGDSSSIRSSIEEKIEEHKRKLEIENALRARYKAGNFKDISPYDFEKIIQELFTNIGYSVFRVGGTSDGGINLKCNNFLAT
jgi:restriction endonuclease Mrr